MSKKDNYYLFLITLFSTLIVLTNVVGIKLIKGPLNPSMHALTSGIITYPLTFLITDIVSELWGEKKSSYMIYLGFFMSCIMLIIVQIVMFLPPHPFWVEPNNTFNYNTVTDYQNAFESVFSVNGKLLFGSMLAFIIAQRLDVFLFHRLKKITKNKYLWLRNNGSTLISQLVDTFIVGSILFYWGFGWDFKQGIQVMLTIYVYKLLIALVDTPLIYFFVRILRKKLNFEK